MAATGNPGGAQFFTLRSQVPLGTGQQLGFAAGRGYYARPAGGASAAPSLAHAAVPQDPYTGIISSAAQPYTSAQIQQLVGQAENRYPVGMTPAQIQAEANNEISPLLAAVTQGIQGQTKAAADAISGYTGSLVDDLKGINWQAPYSQGEQAQAAVDAALQQSLAGTGSSDSADLAKRLAVINDPAVAQAAQAVAANGTANAGTQVAQGSSALGRLIAEGAAAGEFGLKQPGIAAALGLQQLGQNEQQGISSLGTATQQLEGQLPGIVQALTSRSDTNAANRAQAAQSEMDNLLGINTSRAHDITTLKTDQLARNDSLAAGQAKNQTALQVAGIRAKSTAEAAAAKAAENNVKDRLAFAKTYGYDPVTGTVIAGYRKNPDGTVSKIGPAVKTSTLTANELSSAVDGFYTGKPTTIRQEQTDKNGHPILDANGAPVYKTVQGPAANQLTYPQALKRLLTLNVPPQQAMAALDTRYARGERGRAWLTNSEQSILKAAQSNQLGPATGNLAKVQTYQGHGYLTGPQVQALKAAGALPAGELVNGRYFIQPGH